MRGRLLVVLLLVAAACGGEDGDEAAPSPPPGGRVLTLTSSAFEEGETIPVEFTCDGENVSPPLEWSGVPAAAEELTLVVEDPDAPGGTFLHWAVTGIDPSSTGTGRGEVPPGGEQLDNDFGESAYGGPCPPEGDEPHRYVFRVVALDPAADLLGTGTLTGLYGRG